MGDIESQPFLEAIRQFQMEQGRENAILIHVTLIPFLRASGELKTKPTQASVKQLQGMGIQPDILVCRSEVPLGEDVKEKIALFCNVPVSHVLQNLDVEYLYEAPLAMEREHLAEVVCRSLHLPCGTPDLEDWKNMVWNLRHPEGSVTIALVGKYVQLHDAYLSVGGGLKARGDREPVQREHPLGGFRAGDGGDGGSPSRGAPTAFWCRGDLAPGASTERSRPFGTPEPGESPSSASAWGMQLAVIEFARDVIGYEDADSTELNPDTAHPVIALLPEQSGVTDLGGTLRLGAYPCVLEEGSLAEALYGAREIAERHRHRYEFNNEYREVLRSSRDAPLRPVPGRPHCGDGGAAGTPIFHRHPGAPGI